MAAQKLPGFPFNNYDTDNLIFLGEGSYSKVYLSQDKATGNKVAIKQTDMSKLMQENLGDCFQMEVQVMKQLKS